MNSLAAKLEVCYIWSRLYPVYSPSSRRRREHLRVSKVGLSLFLPSITRESAEEAEAMSKSCLYAECPSGYKSVLEREAGTGRRQDQAVQREKEVVLSMSRG